MKTYSNPTLQAQFDALVNFTRGKRIVCDDHRWEPVAHGVVAYTYRTREPVEMDMFEAALEAGRILSHRSVWA